MTNADAATRVKTTRGTTTPIAAFEPVERPDLEGVVDAIADVGEDIGGTVGVADVAGLSSALQFTWTIGAKTEKYGIVDELVSVYIAEEVVIAECPVVYVEVAQPADVLLKICGMVNVSGTPGIADVVSHVTVERSPTRTVDGHVWYD